VRAPEELSLDDVLGKRVVETRLAGLVTVREENAAAALEVMSRFAIEPRWLLYLPPTMAPCATSPTGDLLEHPRSAFEFYREGGVAEVVCEEKHMGSRAMVLVCRDGDIAKTRFGATDGTAGAVYTRTGRSFFEPTLTGTFLEQIRTAISSAGLWEELESDWVLLDGELLPWSAKAEDLLKHQYAAVGAAARAATPAAVTVLQQAAARGVDVSDLLARGEARVRNATAFTEAYRRYVWPVSGLEGVEFAPFQVLATEGRTWTERDHLWHLDIADRLAAVAPGLIRQTKRLVLDTTDEASTATGVDWWTELTAAGGEGMVVKPLANLVRGTRGWTQPGIKVRGREYLRIIYGPDYTEPANLERLRERRLGHKRSLAAREYALGIESLERAARGEPLWRVHEPVFAVLALESEPVDPRL
jgi:protein phosphatase